MVYYSSPFFFDMDLSFAKAMRGKVDFHMVLEVAPFSLRTTAFEQERQDPRNGLIAGRDCQGLGKYADEIDLDRLSVLNIRSSSVFSSDYRMAVGQLRYFLRELAPDIVHINDFPNGFVGALPFFRTPSLISVHDPVPHVGESTFQSRLWRRLYLSKVKNVLLFNGRQDDKFCQAYGSRRTRLFHSRLGPYEYLSGRASPGRVVEGDYILFFGRVSRYKGIDVLLDAFRRIAGRHPGVKLVVAGSGKYWFDIEPSKNDPGVVILNRFIPTEELGALVRDSRFVVCPYIEATQSGVVMSSYAFGKPVVATRVGGLPDMVEDGSTGVLVQPGDPAELAEVLDGLLSDRMRLERFEASIRQRYLGRGEGGWDAIGDGIVEAYRGIVGPGRGRR